MRFKKTYGIWVLGTCPTIYPNEPAVKSRDLVRCTVGKKRFDDNSIKEKKIPFGGSNAMAAGIYGGMGFWGNQESFASLT